MSEDIKEVKFLENWKFIPFHECLSKVLIGKQKQVKEKDYLKTGLYPIVDQGQSFIAGYTNDKTKVITGIAPFIIFGDHTRVLKFIDFDVSLGADGTKIIKPNSDFDPKFFYFYLKNLEIPNRGYNRHYSILKEKQIPKPSLSEQIKISHILTTIENSILRQEELITKLKDLKKSLMHHLFTHGTKNEKTKLTEIGEIPESWEVVELGSVCKPKKKTTNPQQDGKRKYVGLEHINSGDFRLSNFGSEVDVRSSKFLFESGDILYGKLRPYLDKAVKIDFDGMASTDIIVLSSDLVTNNFLLLILHSDRFLQHAIKTTSGVNHPRTSWDSISKYKFALPPKTERLVIEKSIISNEESIIVSQDKLLSYQNLFQTTLHQLMTKEISN